MLTIPEGLAARYGDLVTAAGRRAVAAALDNGTLQQLWRGVVVPGARALDVRTRAAAALLAVGDDAVICGATAVELHGCDAAASQDVHVNLPYSRLSRSRPGLRVHRLRFGPDAIVDLGGLPVVALEVAMAEFLCSGPKWAAFASLDQALRGLDARSAALFTAATRTRLAYRKDSRGVKRATALLALATGQAESPPESFFRLIIVEAGFPPPDPQHEIHTVDGELLYVLDMAWKRLRIGFEYDGYAAHEGREDYDADRDRRLAQRGWIIVRASAEDLKDPSRVIAELSAAFVLRER